MTTLKLVTLNSLSFVTSAFLLTAGCAHDLPVPVAPTGQVSVSVGTPTPPTPPPPQEPVATPYEERWEDVPLNVYFPSGSSRLDDETRTMMREVHASVAHRTDIVRVSVEGHADGRGSAENNERLALERAQGVVDFLVGELGMPRELFEIHSHGESAPQTSGTTATDRMLNRRVSFRILVRRQAAL